MTQYTSLLANWFVTDEHRTKAQIKYELKHLESCLHNSLELDNHAESCSEEFDSICDTLAHRYLDYLKLLNLSNQFDFKKLPPYKIRDRAEHYHRILSLKQQLVQTTNLEEEQQIVTELATLYYQLKTNPNSIPQLINEAHLKDLKQLFKKDNLNLWLKALVQFWNRSATPHFEIPLLFRDWESKQLQLALDFFAEPALVDLVNAIFFYKLYPDTLFKDFIHPEKLVSVRMRLSVLHNYIEMLQHQLNTSAIQYGLKPGVDYFFHGDELPQGIMIDVHEEFREIIQSALKHLKVKFTFENEQQVTIDRLHDLARAYKFWFNPNRLVDAVMVLQQRLVKKKDSETEYLAIFRQEMLGLYHQLTTTECLDLYGYFANNDSRYLLYTLFTLVKGNEVDWLPTLTKTETKAIKEVFLALQTVMEALRDELKNRHISTEAYIYDLEKQAVQTRKRNRDAVFRIIAIYGHDSITLSDAVEKLFHDVEGGEPH